MAVVETPDTRPECSSSTPETAERVAGTNTIPSPIARMVIGMRTPVRYALWGCSWPSSHMPTAAVAVPLAMRGRTPMRPITRGTSPAATIMITVGLGQPLLCASFW